MMMLVMCLHSLETLIDWKRFDSDAQGIKKSIRSLHSLETLIDWKLAKNPI